MAEHIFAGLTCAEVADLAPAFVLGALDAADSDAVRRHLAECPEAHPEMAELHSVVPALFEAVEPVPPPAGLKGRILASAASDPQRATAGAVPPAVTTVPPLEKKRTGERDSAGFFRRPVWTAVSLAAALAVLALGYWNVQLRSDVDVLSAYRNGVVEVLEQAAAPGAQLAVLTAEGGGPSGLAAIAADGTVALVMRDLAPTTGTQVYETWLIAGDAAPVPVGNFTVAAGGLATFETVHSAAGDGVIVALTLEAAPGAQTPTPPIVAAGQARPQEG